MPFQRHMIPRSLPRYSGGLGRLKLAQRQGLRSIDTNGKDRSAWLEKVYWARGDVTFFPFPPPPQPSPTRGEGETRPPLPQGGREKQGPLPHQGGGRNKAPSPTRGEGEPFPPPQPSPTRGEGEPFPPPQPSPTRGEGETRHPPPPGGREPWFSLPPGGGGLGWGGKREKISNLSVPSIPSPRSNAEGERDCVSAPRIFA